MASGGHSHIVEVQDYTHYHILGHTVDDAAGEAFDKVARTLGLPYPGGPSVANAAKTGDPKAYRLPVPHVDGKYNVSFSGLKTAVLNEVNKAQMKGEAVNVPTLPPAFRSALRAFWPKNCCWLLRTPVQSRCVWRAALPPTDGCASW